MQPATSSWWSTGKNAPKSSDIERRSRRNDPRKRIIQVRGEAIGCWAVRNVWFHSTVPQMVRAWHAWLCAGGLLFMFAQIRVLRRIDVGRRRALHVRDIEAVLPIPIAATSQPILPAHHSHVPVPAMRIELPLPPLPPPQTQSATSKARAVAQEQPLLPRNVPCIEFADLEAAHGRCSHPHATLEPLFDCPRASHVEEACAIHPAAVANASCAHAVATDAAHANRPLLSWSDVVFAIATHNSKKEYDLLDVAVHTWVPMTAGADIFVTIDSDDPRNDSKVFPPLLGSDGKHLPHAVQVHIYRCPVCCSGGKGTPGSVPDSVVDSRVVACTGNGVVREGWKARSKVPAQGTRRWLCEAEGSVSRGPWQGSRARQGCMVRSTPRVLISLGSRATYVTVHAVLGPRTRVYHGHALAHARAHTHAHGCRWGMCMCMCMHIGHGRWVRMWREYEQHEPPCTRLAMLLTQVLHMFVEIGRVFGDSQGSRLAKRYVIKLDADATIFPHHLQVLCVEWGVEWRAGWSGREWEGVG